MDVLNRDRSPTCGSHTGAPIPGTGGTLAINNSASSKQNGSTNPLNPTATNQIASTALSTTATGNQTTRSSSYQQAPALDGSIQRNLTNFSLITHGFGTPAIMASLNVVRAYLSESVKIMDRHQGLESASSAAGHHGHHYHGHGHHHHHHHYGHQVAASTTSTTSTNHLEHEHQQSHHNHHLQHHHQLNLHNHPYSHHSHLNLLHHQHQTLANSANNNSAASDDLSVSTNEDNTTTTTNNTTNTNSQSYQLSALVEPKKEVI